MDISRYVSNVMNNAGAARDASRVKNLSVVATLLGPAMRGLVLQQGKQGETTHMPASHAAAFTWQYRQDQPEMAKLYAAAKTSQWDPDKVLESCPPKRRNKVRKGLKGGLIIENGDSLDRHYEIYAESVRNLGTPVFPKRYFANILAGFGKDAEIITVNHRGRPLAVALQLYFRDEATPYYTGRSEAGQSLNAFDVLTYACMRRAAERGVRVFDFGRSKRGTGAFEFKDQWGFEPTPLPYEFWLRGGNALPDTNPLNPKYRLFIAAWRRLPLGLANRLGPMIVGGLG